MNTEEMLIKIKELKNPDRSYSINDSLQSLGKYHPSILPIREAGGDHRKTSKL